MRKLSMVLVALLMLSAPTALAIDRPHVIPPNAVAMDTDYTGTCRVFSDGDAECRVRGFVDRFDGLDIATMSVGYSSGCYLTKSSVGVCFNWSTPRSPFVSAAGARSVAAGENHTCIVVATRNVECRGYNGDGRAAGYYGGNANMVAAGPRTSCALLIHGNVICWGDNSGGQRVGYNGGDAISVSVGYSHACVVRTNGRLACWGDAGFVIGQPAYYEGDQAVAVAAGVFTTCALLRSGNTHCRGFGPLERQHHLLGDAVGIGIGDLHYCVLTRAGDVVCYGAGITGEAAPIVGLEPVVSSSPKGLDVCDDWNGNGECEPREVIATAPASATLNGPTGVTIGPDADGDGLPSQVTLQSGSTTIHFHDGSITRSDDPAQAQIVGVDPSPEDPSDPAGVRRGTIRAATCADGACLDADVEVALLGERILDPPAIVVPLDGPADALADSTGYRPYGVSSTGITLRGAPAVIDAPIASVSTPTPLQQVSVGASRVLIACDGPGEVQIGTVRLSGTIATAVPGSTRMEPSALTGPRCALVEAAAEDRSVGVDPIVLP